MSRYPTEQDTLNNENISDQERRTQTDSVHERFRSDFYYVHCDDCKGKIEPNKAAIEKHYENKSHPSNRTCRYCRGKVFMYQSVVNGADNGKSYIFHRCKHEYFPEESITDES